MCYLEQSSGSLRVTSGEAWPLDYWLVFSSNSTESFHVKGKPFIDWACDAAAGERWGWRWRVGGGRELRENHFCFLFSHRGFLCQSEALHLILGKWEVVSRNPECRFHTNSFWCIGNTLKCSFRMKSLDWGPLGCGRWGKSPIFMDQTAVQNDAGTGRLGVGLCSGNGSVTGGRVSTWGVVANVAARSGEGRRHSAGCNRWWRHFVISWVLPEKPGKALARYGLTAIIQDIRVYTQASQVVKNLPAMQETQVQSLGWKSPWKRKWQPTLVFLPGKSHLQRSLAGYNPRGHKELDTTEQLNVHANACTYKDTHTHIFLPWEEEKNMCWKHRWEVSSGW